MSTTPRLNTPLLAAAQAQKHVTHNEALEQLDALICARFLDRDLSAPPASPTDGDAYLVKATATGAWAGHDNAIAYALDGAWRFTAPFTGLVAYLADEQALIVYTGSSWVDYASLLNLQNVPLLGVNATADATNKLTVASSAILLNNIGAGVQAKLNKNASGDTASLLYQTGFSGRAELGLTGDDHFHLKVSPDGSVFTEALHINNSDGAIDLLASETTIASAATADLGTATSLKVQITGTTTITSFGTAAYRMRFVRFAAALTLTHNATSLILPGGANIATAAGDCCLVMSDSSGNWRVRHYQRAAASLALQLVNAAAITGGAIDNTAIGGTTPAAGAFTGLTVSKPAISGSNVTTTPQKMLELRWVEGVQDLGMGEGARIAFTQIWADASNYEGASIGSYKVSTSDTNSATGLVFSTRGNGDSGTGPTGRLWLTDAGWLGIGASMSAPTGLLDIADDHLRVRTAKTPASSTATGNAGDVCWDANYFYVCTATNTWRRAAHATW